MKRIRGLLGALLALVLLSGCTQTALPEQTDPKADSGTVAYVPLDDRPDNEERVEYLAQSLGYTLNMPNEDLYKTRLDGQGTNANGTQSGDRAALYEWVLRQEADGCNLYILSLDQILSGGLVASRALQGENPVTLSNGTELTESQLLKKLLETLGADKNNRVWLLDTVMRLAPTVGYGGFGLTEYNGLRTYGMTARPALTGNNLTVDKIVADYPLGYDGQPITPDASLPAGSAADYLAARERKLRLTDELLSVLHQDGYNNFRVLIGIDDSSAEDSVQKNEIAYFRQHLREEDAILSGVDDLGFKAVAKLYLEQCGWSGATAAVQYFGGCESKAACDYDYQPLKDIVEEHLAFFGLNETGTDTAQLQILVLTAPADESRKEEYTAELIRAINSNEEHGRPTIVIDASNNSYGTSVHDQMVQETHLGWLLAYSGFLDMAIVTGTALSHGIARYAWLCNGAPDDTAANRAFVRTLADSVVKDFCYRNTVRNDLYAYVRDTLSGSPDNFCTPGVDQTQILTQLESAMTAGTGTVLKNFGDSNLIIGLEPYRTVGCGELTLSDYAFPWQRVFEFRMEIGVGTFTRPHEGLL